MDEAIIEGNCGELCGYHCCRQKHETGERLGMYLQPLEYEYVQKDIAIDYEIHYSTQYDMPPKIKKSYYIFCKETQCMRNFRPIQCRTYPFEPHIENGKFSLVIEKEQIHQCPLLESTQTWRQEFIDGIYKGWQELMKIPMIQYSTIFYSNERIAAGNISKRYAEKGWVEV